MITYLTTFEEKRNTSFTNEVVSFSRTTEYYQYETFFDTLVIGGVHTETTSESYSVTSTSTSTYLDTYSYTYTLTQLTLVSFADTIYQNTTTSVSDSSSYTSSQSSFVGSTFYTDACNIPYNVSTESYSYTQYDFYLNATKTYSVYGTTTHNAPYDHSVFGETYSSVTYTSSNTYTYSTTSVYSYTDTRYSYQTTTQTITDYAYTTYTATYETTASLSSSSIASQSTSYSVGSYETQIADTKETSSGHTFISVFQNGSITSYTSWTTESSATYLTITLIQSYSYFFGYISKGGAGLTTSHYTQSRSKYSLNSYVGTRTPTATTNFRSETYSENTTTAQTSGSSFSVSDWGGSSSNTTSSSNSSSSEISFGGTTESPIYTVAIVTTTNSYSTYSVTTTITSSTNITQLGTGYTGTTTSIGTATSNTTKTTAITNTVATTISSTVSSTSWTDDGYRSHTNVVPMKTAYVFKRLPEERMFYVSSTSLSFVAIKDLVLETSIYSAIPSYTTSSTHSEFYDYVLSGSSITTQSAITQTAFVVTQYGYGTPSFTISETSGLALSPFGAYGFPATSVTYGVGIYDITSRTMANSSIQTNATIQSTVSASVSEIVVNGDKRIHPRITITANTAMSSTTVFSLRGAVAFTTTSLANP